MSELLLTPINSAKVYRQVNSHYDPKANRWRVEIENRPVDTSVDPDFVNRSIADGQAHAFIAFSKLDPGKRTFTIFGRSDVPDFDAANQIMDDLMRDE